MKSIREVGWRGKAVAALTAAVVAVSLAACSGGGGSAGSDKNTLTIGADSAPSSLDLTKGGNGGSQMLYQELAYAPLIDVDKSGKLIPGLATDWKYTVGGKEFQLTIRDGAKFADGTAVTPKAVAASINYYVKTSSAGSSTSFKGVTAAATGAHVVTLTSATPNPILPQLLTPYNLGGDIMSAAGLANPAKLETATFGAGPYVYDASQSIPGNTYVYTPNKNYFDQSKVSFGKVVVKVIVNSTSAFQALRSGQIDVFNADPTQYDQAKQAKLTVSRASSAWVGAFIMDWGGVLAPALGNKKVRQALNYAVDRPAIAKAVYGSLGTATDQPNTPGWDAYDKSLESAYSYDPDRARQLLKDAGYPNGFSFTLLYTAFQPTTTKVVQAYAEQWAKVGVTVQLTGVQNFTEFDAGHASKKYSAIALQAGGQTQFVNTQQFWLQNSVVNPWLVPPVAGLQSAFDAYAASDDAGRAAAAHKVQKILVDQGVTVPAASFDTLWLSSPSLKGFALTPTGNPLNPIFWSKS